ncbi:MAG: plasmid recombination protein [Lachnospiraceae bacterium]|nr:plasmid recombination protein [Lachnospiraceae bacterium]
MANYENFKRGDFGLFAHCERKKDENGRYVTFGNQMIDSARSYLNYNLCPDARRQVDIVEERLSDPNLKCQNRADVNIYGSWCVTLPTHIPDYDDEGNMLMEDKEVHHRDGTVTQSTVPKLKEVHYTDDQVQLFFKLTYDFLSERYKKENVISSYVHLDETTPHTHFLFIPVVDDKKWNEKNPEKHPRQKVCAKELMNKNELNMFHRVFQEYLDSHSETGLFPVLNGTTVGGNRTIAELKAEEETKEARDKIRKVREEKELATKEAELAKKEVEHVKNKVIEYMQILQSAKEDTYKEFEYFVSAVEKEELPMVQDLKGSLEQLDAKKLDVDTIKKFSDALEHPINGGNGKTYVEVPNPKVMIPILKNVADKLGKVLTKIKDIHEKVIEKAGHTRIRIKELIAEKQAELDCRRTQKSSRKLDKSPKNLD